MKLLYVFATILAISLAETDKEKREIADSESAASVELLREAPDLKAEASAYNTYVPPNTWNQPSYPAQNTWYPPSQPVNTWNPPQEPVNTWNPPKEPVNTWNPPKEPVNTWNPPKEPVKPWNPPVKPVNTWVPPVQNDQIYVHPTYPPVQNTWSTPQHHPPTTTTPLPVIKNEQHFYDNGAYKYEYQIGDGTHVGEEGYYTDPKQTDESLVKKGWYSFVGADGKTYTVTYWADKTGFHAYGDHLPTPPPVPAAIQAALDKEKEAEKYTTQAPHYPTQATYIPPNKPSNHVHNPTGYYPPTHYPTQQNQPSYYPPQQNNHNYG